MKQRISLQVVSIKTSQVTLVLCVAILMCAGCASITQHSGHSWATKPMPRYVYSGTGADIQTMQGKTLDSGNMTDVLFGPIGMVASFFDLPFSFAVDTLVLPYDTCMVTIGGKRRSGEDRRPKQQTTNAGSRTAP